MLYFTPFGVFLLPPYYRQEPHQSSALPRPCPPPFLKDWEEVNKESDLEQPPPLTTEHLNRALPQKPSARRPPRRKKGKFNLKNIIPNLVRKLFCFLLSDRCRQLLTELYPSMSKTEVSRIVNFTTSVKNMIGTYLGRRSLQKLWVGENRNTISGKQHEALRRVSKYFLENECINSIITSRRIKLELKEPHLEYRRKIMGFLAKCSL